jgi:hypothetical protein
MERATTKLVVGVVAFCGNFGDPDHTNDPENDRVLDPDRAADELRQAGFEVHRFPRRYWGRLAHPLDDFLEVTCPDPGIPEVVDAIWDQIEAIVSPYAGYCDSCGTVERDGYVPFVADFVYETLAMKTLRSRH